MNFSDIRVAKKLAIGFSAIVLIISVSAVYLFQETTNLREIERVNSASSAAIGGLDTIRGDLARAQSLARKLVMTGREADRAKFDKEIGDYAVGLAALRTLLTQEAPHLLPPLEDYDKAVTTYVNASLNEEVRLSLSPATHQQALEMEASGAEQPIIDAVNSSFDRLRSKLGSWSQAWKDFGHAAMNRMLTTVAISGIVSALLAGLMAWLIGRAIARPIGAMTGVMEALARGDHSVNVPAIGQRDEIGEMAGAVQVFKTAAIEKLRLEADAAAAGRLTEEERARNSAMLAEASEQQTRVVECLASGLANLSSGNLAHRIVETFPPDYERLRADFNAAMDRLHETLRIVSNSASAIRQGTNEISTASDDGRVPADGVGSAGATSVTGSGRDGQATRVGRLTEASSPIGAMLSSVM